MPPWESDLGHQFSQLTLIPTQKYRTDVDPDQIYVNWHWSWANNPLLPPQLSAPALQSISTDMIPDLISSTDVGDTSILIRYQSPQLPDVNSPLDSSNRRRGHLIYLLSTDIGDSINFFQPTTGLSNQALWLLRGHLKYWFLPFLIPPSRLSEALLACILKRLFVYLFTSFHGHVACATS